VAGGRYHLQGRGGLAGWFFVRWKVLVRYVRWKKKVSEEDLREERGLCTESPWFRSLTFIRGTRFTTEGKVVSGRG